MNDNIKVITFRVPQDEYDLLEWYCKETTQTKTAVLRELVRTLDPTVLPSRRSIKD